MRGLYFRVLCFLLSQAVIFSVYGQDTARPVKVAVFVPLYTDAVLSGSVYDGAKTTLPKNVLPGLEFYNGTMLAIDSLNKERAKVEMYIYDTRQSTRTITEIIKKAEADSIGLMIAAITNTEELKAFSSASLSGHIPLISATYPNYVGVSQNPYFILLNSSFQAHLSALYRHMQKYYSGKPIIALTKKGTTEEYIKNYFIEQNKTSGLPPLKFKWVNVVENTLTPSDIAHNFDSTSSNTVLVASLTEKFGLEMVRTLSSAEKYAVTAIGMPTWDGIKELDRSGCKNVDIVFSTPFLYYSQNPELSAAVNRYYKEKYFSRPSDMVFKGFETTYHFTRLLIKHGANLVNNITDTSFTLFNHFMFEPVKVNKTLPAPDFLENRKLYFIKKSNGEVKSII